MKISCETIQDLLPLYEDRILRPNSEKLVRDHLKSCSVCKAYLKCMKSSAQDNASYAVLPDTAGEDYRTVAKKLRRRRAHYIGVLAAAGIFSLGMAVFSILSKKKD